MEIRELDTALSKAVQIGSLNLSPERSHVRESEIISNDEEEIGPFCHCGLGPSLGFKQIRPFSRKYTYVKTTITSNSERWHERTFWTRERQCLP
jgi:hypothetical protein